MMWVEPGRDPSWDVAAPTGETRKLFVQGNIPNHGVLGRSGAAGDVPGRIADCELDALDLMDRAWPEVKDLK